VWGLAPQDSETVSYRGDFRKIKARAEQQGWIGCTLPRSRDAQLATIVEELSCVPEAKGL
jgi:hypothetical protein